MKKALTARLISKKIRVKMNLPLQEKNPPLRRKRRRQVVLDLLWIFLN
jgi:hypothetical protein